jgi:hypothetical protein
MFFKPLTPPATDDSNPLMMFDDSALIDALREILSDEYAQDVNDTVSHYFTRFDVYLIHNPSEHDYLITNQSNVAREVLTVLAKRYNLIMPYEDIDFTSLRLLARELYKLFVVHRDNVLVHFLSYWIDANRNVVCDFPNIRCTDIVYEHYRKKSPENAALLYKFHHIINLLAMVEKPVEDSVIMSELIKHHYPFLDTTALQHQFGLRHTVPKICLGNDTFYRLMRVLTHGPKSAELRMSIISRLPGE